ncbi:MAG: 3-phosphoserine/phosphohydroxythreonine transaminase [Candidatus Eisenbacteria bacterium]|nr:3-phosphoserine/phosphohydroxythreonine transaminase [Candidatus Eisenbacteria bacterium]
MSHRVHNFNPGPAALPLPVLEQVQRELIDFQGTGMSILEASHRGKAYEAVHFQAIADLKALVGAGEEWKVLFMGGGASAQFALAPMNLIPQGGFAQYVTTGSWSEAALKEAKKLGDARELYTSGPDHKHVPKSGQVAVDPKAAYVHYTSNNTIYGTEYDGTPEFGHTGNGPGHVPLIADMSSDILSRPIELDRHAVIYAGAQKNLGPSGVAVVWIHQSALERCRGDVPQIWSYRKFAEKDSLLNTPPCFPIYIVGLVARYLLEAGGLTWAKKRNDEKARILYNAIDDSAGFYRGHAEPGSRSQMNVTFRLPTPELEDLFAKQSTAAGLIGLKGHRSVGGMRASIYNAVPLESVQALVGFMQQFRGEHG